MRLALIFVLALAALPALAQPYPRPPVAERIAGEVVRVIDGDGIVVRRADGHEVEIRLQGIDAPELDQDCEDAAGARYHCGAVAGDRMRALAYRRQALCETPADDPIDMYDRRLAFCSVGTVDLNLTMLEEGLAVVFRRYLVEHPQLGRRPHADAFLAAEGRARLARRGLWRGMFTPPWAHRAARRRR